MGVIDERRGKNVDLDEGVEISSRPSSESLNNKKIQLVN